jgi:hypothetical protein
MTTREELKALMSKYKVPANFTVYQELCLGVSVDEYWNKVLADDAPVGDGPYFAGRGDLNYVSSKWKPAETAEEKEYKPEKGTNLTAKMVKDHKVDI